MTARETCSITIFQPEALFLAVVVGRGAIRMMQTRAFFNLVSDFLAVLISLMNY